MRKALLRAQLTAALVQVEDAKPRGGKANKETTEKAAIIEKLTEAIAVETPAKVVASRRKHPEAPSPSVQAEIRLLFKELFKCNINVDNNADC
jgi:hypothetical protein